MSSELRFAHQARINLQAVQEDLRSFLRQEVVSSTDGRKREVAIYIHGGVFDSKVMYASEEKRGDLKAPYETFPAISFTYQKEGTLKESCCAEKVCSLVTEIFRKHFPPLIDTRESIERRHFLLLMMDPQGKRVFPAKVFAFDYHVEYDSSTHMEGFLFHSWPVDDEEGFHCPLDERGSKGCTSKESTKEDQLIASFREGPFFGARRGTHENTLEEVKAPSVSSTSQEASDEKKK